MDGITLVHGAYEDEDEYVFVPGQAMGGLLESPTDVTFFGHTHHQGGFSYRAGQIGMIQLRPDHGPKFAALRMEPGTRYLLNPGSIGQPRDGDPRAAFAIADLDHHIIEFWRVPYDIAAVQKRMEKAGLPYPLVERLGRGPVALIRWQVVTASVGWIARCYLQTEDAHNWRRIPT